MRNIDTVSFIKNILSNMPSDWINLTTHRLDIYNETQAKTQFLDQFEKLQSDGLSDIEMKNKLLDLPTAFDYIRLGHPLSCILEWVLAKSKDLDVANVISFSSKTMPILAILRKNLLSGIKTQIVYTDNLPQCFDTEVLQDIYSYDFNLVQIQNIQDIPSFDGYTVLLTNFKESFHSEKIDLADTIISIHPEFGSVAIVGDKDSEGYISEIQHVRRRESIAMTPKDCVNELKEYAGESVESVESNNISESARTQTLSTINNITNSATDASLGSCGLSIQYAIMMGLIHHSIENNMGKIIKLIVPPNCYGGTNDQARRVAACIENVEIMDLPVDGNHNMVQSVELVLDQVAKTGAVPFIIAEIPTNPRVEVPDLDKLNIALTKKRKTSSGEDAVEPVFILDQTFCPNLKFLGDEDILSDVNTISYVSGSKFPSGGLCTAGYCVSNKKAAHFMSYIDKHLKICDNGATQYQIDVLSKQMPSMLKRIDDAYKNTRGFVNHIFKVLPEAKINFVSEELAKDGFTPSVFSLDLPTIGDTHEEKESYKRELNYKLINLMISEIPLESKHCVSYGQLKGCYWTIPATSTQGTTKEGDKDYIVRVAISPEFDLEKHKSVFTLFCKENIIA